MWMDDVTEQEETSISELDQRWFGWKSINLPITARRSLPPHCHTAISPCHFVALIEEYASETKNGIVGFELGIYVTMESLILSFAL